MTTCENGLFRQSFRRDVPKVQILPVPKLHPQHLIEIAVKDLSLPANIDGAAAHESSDRGGVEAVGQQFHVGIPMSSLPEIRRETRDG